MKKIVIYSLVDGTVPDFIIDGGHFLNDEGNMIGIVEDNVELPSNVQVINTKQELEEHLIVCSNTWEDTVDPFPTKAPSIEDATNYIWNKISQ
jgi:hypothetical protein